MNTFLNRVSAERMVLKAVNGTFAGAEQLAGLSQAALSHWQSVVGQERVALILPLLISLGEECQRLSDRSNETFVPVEEAQVTEIEEKLKLLKRMLNQCQ
jgi:hypothetical protein